MAKAERMSEDVTDSELIARYLNGSQDAFEELYQRYRRPLYAYLNRMLPGRHSLADDLFQKCWMKVIDNLHKYRDQDAFISWLYRIAHNTAVDHFRREKRSPEITVDQLPDVDGGGMPGSELHASEMHDAISAAVHDLPEDQREVFLLRQQGVAFKDIATIQNASINTVLGRMHYAVQKLRRSLQDWR